GPSAAEGEPEPERLLRTLGTFHPKRVSRPDHSFRRKTLEASGGRVSRPLPHREEPPRPWREADRVRTRRRRERRSAHAQSAPRRAAQVLLPRGGLMVDEGSREPATVRSGGH